MGVLPDHAALASALGTDVTIELDTGDMVHLRIAAVSPVRDTGGFESFSVSLEGPSQLPLGQGTFPMRNDALGEFLLFIVPAGDDGTTRLYHATISRRSGDATSTHDPLGPGSH